MAQPISPLPAAGPAAGPREAHLAKREAMASTAPPQPRLGVRAKGTSHPRHKKAVRPSLPRASPLLPPPPAPALPDLAA
jgi:hypothetical protein